MKRIDVEKERIKNFGVPAEKIHERGEMTVWERIEYLVDSGTFPSFALSTLFSTRKMKSQEAQASWMVWRASMVNGASLSVSTMVNGWPAPGLPDRRKTPARHRHR